MPERTRHLASGTWLRPGGCSPGWGCRHHRRGDRGAAIRCGASAGTYLALAALNRLVAPCSKLAFGDWWKTTAADRFTKVSVSALGHRRFWDAMHAVSLEDWRRSAAGSPCGSSGPLAWMCHRWPWT